MGTTDDPTPKLRGTSVPVMPTVCSKKEKAVDAILNREPEESAEKPKSEVHVSPDGVPFLKKPQAKEE